MLFLRSKENTLRKRFLVNDLGSGEPLNEEHLDQHDKEIPDNEADYHLDLDGVERFQNKASSGSVQDDYQKDTKSTNYGPSVAPDVASDGRAKQNSWTSLCQIADTDG